jgi:predicted Ser/Thr protein kinase
MTPMAKTILNGRYELGEQVGKGGMAVTYRAHDTLLNRTVAVKVMREQFSSDPAFVERFRREAQAAAGLTHENIASIYDTGTDGELHYIVMEFVEGENLEERLRRQGPLEPLAAIEIALQIVAALDAAHRRGIVHRDVKPHNILINSEGRVKVTDFGIAKAIAASSQTETGLIMGSVHYFSPEQARGDATGPQSDLYSLGIVLFEALTGKRPFEGANPVAVAHKQIYDQPPLPSEYRPDVPEELESIVLKCLEKSLARRYASAAELCKYLENAREELMAGASRARNRRAPARAPGRWRQVLAWLGVAVVIALIAAGAYVALTRTGNAGQVLVPDLSGLDPTSAERLLSEIGLSYRVAPDGLYADVPAGMIARQNPLATSRVKPHTRITVWISLGPQYATVPDVTRMSLDQAERRLKQAELEPGRAIEQYDDAVAAGYVISSEPAAGQRVGKRTQVTLLVSKGTAPPTVEPTPPGGGGAEATIAYTVPDDVGSDRVQVRVEVTDDAGKRVLYDAPHMAGDQLPTLKVRYTGHAVVRVFINDRERWSEAFAAPAPKPEPPQASQPETKAEGTAEPAPARP